jgi:hypothetical protein
MPSNRRAEPGPGKNEAGARSIRIGSGAGFAGDRLDPAILLAEKGELDFLVFECLAERTIALAQLRRSIDPGGGYDPMLADRLRAVLEPCVRNRVRIVTNMGAANPVAAAKRVATLAQELGISNLKIAAVVGDDVLNSVVDNNPRLDIELSVADLGDRLVSANAYMGSFEIARALDEGADIVITGRTGDPALFVGPMVHAFGWAEDDWQRLGRGTAVGHMLECAGQLTGGYFADPGYKDVPDLANLGFPIAEIDADGHAVFSKVAGSGGLLSKASCTEQLLYEIFDPANYLQPDVTVDFTAVQFDDVEGGIRMSGATGRERPAKLKVSVGYHDGFIGEGQISYAGPGAVARGRLALEIVRQRLAMTGIATEELRLELIGVDATNFTAAAVEEVREVRIRVAARVRDQASAIRVGAEVEALYTNGPSGGGGAWSSAREVIAIASCFIDRAQISPQIKWVQV